jgi:hypothetical protein
MAAGLDDMATPRRDAEGVRDLTVNLEGGP